MIDMAKFQKLSDFKSKSGVPIIKFWELQKLFVCCSLDGELIFNGSGNSTNHKIVKLFNDEPIYDFNFVDEYQILVVSEDPTPILVDIRKI